MPSGPRRWKVLVLTRVTPAGGQSHGLSARSAGTPPVKLKMPPMVRTSERTAPIRENPLRTLQRRQLVGHDILLARHGNHICTMRVDRGAGRVIAFLDDGSTDSAPNLISPQLSMPDTLRSVLREDWKFLAVASACTTAFAGVLVAAAVALAGLAGGDPVLAQMLTYAGS